MSVDELIAQGVEWHLDAGHGWLKVPMALIDEYDLADPTNVLCISQFSYHDAYWAYLEEDVDCSRFFEALDLTTADVMGKFPVHNDGDYSPIHRLERFHA